MVSHLSNFLPSHLNHNTILWCYCSQSQQLSWVSLPQLSHTLWRQMDTWTCSKVNVIIQVYNHLIDNCNSHFLVPDERDYYYCCPTNDASSQWQNHQDLHSWFQLAAVDTPLATLRCTCSIIKEEVLRTDYFWSISMAAVTICEICLYVHISHKHRSILSSLSYRHFIPNWLS